MTTVFKPKSETQILIVDDVPDNLRLLGKILELEDYVVRKTLNGRMALQSIYHELPDLVLLDINMPGINGFEVCQQLRASEETAEIPVIFISALTEAEDKVKAFQLGGQDYITKPFQSLEVLARVSNQLLIQQQKQQLRQAVQHREQAEAEIRQLNADLEQQIEARTLKLQQALSFEVALKHISDQVRDSLDQHQIIQRAVETLAWALNVQCCDAALYSPDRSTAIIRYQWLQPEHQAIQEQLLQAADLPEIYQQLQERLCFAFCQLQPCPNHSHSAILACPIFDDRVEEIGILGTLGLLKMKAAHFDEMEINLVQQVANQCAIALRQARLYEAAQAQVKELERLSQLKDDFLSTISHELRSPIASMKTVLRLLTTETDDGRNLAQAISESAYQGKRIVQYFQILQEECDREIALIEDLLSLQHIEAGIHTVQATPLDLQKLIPRLVEPFESRAQHQQQTLQVAISPDLPSLNLDPGCLNRTVTELLTNACKYTPAGETIFLSVSVTQDSAVNLDRHLELKVINTGVEIAAEEIPHVFDKFYRIPNNDPWKYGGTGLGLALIKNLIEKMGGTIEVESANHQTCFIVRLIVTA